MYIDILLGKQHHQYGTKATQLQTFGNVLISEIKSRMGNNWGTKQRDAWTWFWRQISETMIKSLAKENAKHANISNDNSDDNDYVKVKSNNNDEMKE